VYPSAKPPLLLIFIATLIGLGVILPLVYLAIRAAGANTEQLSEIVFRSRNLLLLWNTLSLGLGVLVATTAIALPLAWLTTRSSLKGKRGLALLITLPLAVPGYVGALALLGASGSGGLIDSLVGLAWPRPSGYWGALGVLSLFLYPYLFLGLRTAFLGLDQSLEESAYSLGYSRRAAFIKVVLPQLRPALYAGWLLVGLHVLGDFGVVSLMRFETFSSAIYLQYANSFDRVYAAWLSLLLLLVTMCALWLEARFLGRMRLSRVGMGSARKSQPVALGYWSLAAYSLIALTLGAALVIPLGALFVWGFSSQTSLWTALANSAQAAAPTALVATLLALPVTYLAVRFPSKLARFLERTAYLGYATPPLAFALAFVFFSLKGAPFLYQTFGLLVLAYVFHFLAEAIGPIRTALYQAPSRLEEAGRSLGLNPVRSFIRVTFPLLRRGLLASMALVFLSVMKELPLTLLLAPTGYDTLATRIWGFTTEALYAQAAPYALAVVGFSACFVGVLLTQENRV
jgi:iron(III) transport system permease protein